MRVCVCVPIVDRALAGACVRQHARASRFVCTQQQRCWVYVCVCSPTPPSTLLTPHTPKPFIHPDKPPGCKNRLGRAQRVSIRSLGWDGQLTIDGITMIPFNFGVQVRTLFAREGRHMSVMHAV